MKFDITVSRAEEEGKRLSRLAAKMGPVTRSVIADKLEAILVLLEGQVKKKTPTDTGALRASIYSEVRITGMSLEGLVSTPLLYGPAVEFGRGKGKKMPPPDALLGWLRRKGIDEGAASAVARAIQNNGIEGKHMFEDAWDENLERVSSMLKKIEVHVSKELLRKL